MLPNYNNHWQEARNRNTNRQPNQYHVPYNGPVFHRPLPPTNRRPPTNPSSYIPPHRRPTYNTAYQSRGKHLPRFNGFDGYLLPSAGEISQKVLTNVSEPALTPLANLHQVFGQFLAHDIVLTKTLKTPSGGNYKCCKDTGIDETLGLRGEPCYPIKWPNPVGDHGCGNFVRTVGEIDCKSHIREPINFLTAFVDGSGVYGSTKDESHSLRSFVGGKLTKSAHDLLPARGNPHDKSNCILFTENDFCFDAGK
ncbi:hypothetical protein LOTGIDRAFT_176310 [Lottia gigantea]|uniref:Uncharacterized protein n=1 Tax=Lottia gigantea TaxID=225164 RepID=V4B1K2_LOTGI|nr:hypothetical protein LOTGIDRAFT_176310 [Lottia gigantea]ESO82114.1 hypothetical protein LOTGIDRAFT_176310 [Lottia gigantea]